MFSKSACRVALSGPQKSPSAVAAAAAASPTARNLSSRASSAAASRHQRRHSSSKASYPPGGPRGSEPAAENTTGAAEDDKRSGSNGRLPRRRPRDSSATEKAAMKARDEAFANIPAVPSTTHLQLGDVHTSSFFSMHRPISVTTSIPPVDNPRTIAQFESIFKPAPSSHQHKPSDVIYTLSNTAAALESSAQSREEKDLRWEVLQQSSSNAENANGNRRSQRGGNVIHLDGPPQNQSLEELVKQFRPFNVPPPPVPFDDVKNVDGEQSSQHAGKQQASEGEDLSVSKAKARRLSGRPTRKTFTTTLTMTEVTSSSGQKTYSASASPIVERATRNANTPQARQPFLARLYDRQTALEEFLEDRAQKENNDMWAISVKRQRKLKMKKHKYKKLMRRTRNLRRREGRA